LPRVNGTEGEGLFGWNPTVDWSLGGTDFQWEMDTMMDRLLGRDGASIADAGTAANQIAGAAGNAATENIMAAIEPWVGRVAMIILALVFIAGGIALLGGPKVASMAREALPA